MSFRISPLWWPPLALASPILLPKLLLRNRSFTREVAKAREVNGARIRQAEPLDLPELDFAELQVLVEQKAEPGYTTAPGVSYLFRTNMGSLLFDVGFGPEQPALSENAARIGFTMDKVDALAISHLHPDHMGGFKAARKNAIRLPAEFTTTERDCYVPARAGGDNLNIIEVNSPTLLAAGIGSTGPLARPLFLMGWTEEQSLLFRIKNKGIVIFTGCGHPTIELIVEMVRRLCNDRIYIIGGGLHFPVTDSPFRKPGLKVQMIWGTGKPPWQRITEADLQRTCTFINHTGADKIYLSAHDSCDHALATMNSTLNGSITVLHAGATYRL